MAARLTDEQKKRIIADYVEIGSYNAVAKLHGISATSVKNVVCKNVDCVQKCEHKKEQNSDDILAHMESRKRKVIDIIDLYLDEMLNPVILAKATPSQLTTALGTLIDKFTAVKAAVSDDAREDDALTRALKEEAERMEADADIS